MERKLRERNEEMKEKAEAEELLNFKEKKFKLLAAPVERGRGTSSHQELERTRKMRMLQRREELNLSHLGWKQMAGKG